MSDIGLTRGASWPQPPIGQDGSGNAGGDVAAPLAPGLYVVATPIGNLRDITLRALDVLQAADHILAEDTRQSRKLCEAFSIQTTLSPFHDHNAAKRIPTVLERLQSGESIALISDAGTPLVSDPGFKLVRACVEAGVDVWPLPGASAPLAALVKSGLPSDRFFFAGFLPPKSAARRSALAELKEVRATLILFETGPRIVALLDAALQVFGDRPAVLTRELTKRYEEARTGAISEILESVKADPPRGEIVMLFGPPEGPTLWDEATLRAALAEALPELGAKRASAKLAAASGWAKRDIYAIASKL